MNVAVFGWYHHRNAGDDRIQAAITRWLDGHTLAFLPAGRPPSLHFLRTYDAVLLGGGGLLLRRGGVFRDMARWTRAAGVPVALVGVGLEREDPELVAELRRFLDVACFAWFRDRGSLAAVGEHPRAFVAPDLTWLHPFAHDDGDGDGSVAVCLGATAAGASDGWAPALAALGRPLRPFPLFFEGGGDARVLKETIGGDVPDELDLTPARMASAVVTSRFHGLLFALQLGRPALAVSDEPKVQRFLAEHGLAEWRVSPGEPDALVELWPRFEAAWPALRQTAAELRERLTTEARRNAKAARERLLAAAGDEADARHRRRRARLRRLLDLGLWET